MDASAGGTLKESLISYIASHTPALFFQRVVEEIESGFFEAHQHAETFEGPDRVRIHPQLQNYRTNSALRKAGSDVGMIACACATDPKGENYSLVELNGVRFGQVCLPFDNNTPRFAKHRKLIAAVNSRLEPVNVDLFSSEKAEEIDDGLGCLIVAVKPHRREPQSMPFSVLVGVPYTNLRSWHLLVPVAEIMAAYHPSEQIDVPDLAFAKLKRRMNDLEK